MDITIRKLFYDDDRKCIEQYNNSGVKYPIMPLYDGHDDGTDEFISYYYQQSSIDPADYGAFDGDKLVGHCYIGNAGQLGLEPASGFGDKEFTNKDAVFSIEVQDNYKMRGIGRKLLMRAVTDYHDSRFAGIIEEDNLDNSGLKYFYKRLGFNVSKFGDGRIDRPSQDTMNRSYNKLIQLAKNHESKPESQISFML